jgi:hypothetical protein
VDDGCGTGDCSATKAEINYDTQRYNYKNCGSGAGGGCADYKGAIIFGVVGLTTIAGAGPVIDAVGGTVSGWLAGASTAACTSSDCIDDVVQMPANAIRFTQDSISAFTKGKTGVYLDTLTDEISNGFFRGGIRVTEFAGKLWSLDNRRLAAFKLLDNDVPVKILPYADVAEEFAKKFTTITDGLSIIIRNTDIVIK